MRGAGLDDAIAVVAPIVSDVRERGDEAVLEWTERFDGPRPDGFRVSAEAIRDVVADPEAGDAIADALLSVPDGAQQDAASYLEDLRQAAGTPAVLAYAPLLRREVPAWIRDRALDAVVREGGATVQKTIRGFGKLRDAIGGSSAVMKEMGKRAEEIGDIVQTINLIADRTNLLSLNASIEAARAGEHGRGFAVVAEEIRALADRAAASSAEIAKIVRGLQSTLRDAVTSSSESARVAEEGTSLAEEADRALGTMLRGVEAAGGAGGFD